MDVYLCKECLLVVSTRVKDGICVHESAIEELNVVKRASAKVVKNEDCSWVRKS